MRRIKQLYKVGGVVFMAPRPGLCSDEIQSVPRSQDLQLFHKLLIQLSNLHD